MRMRSYEDWDWWWFDDIEYDDQGVDDRVYGLDDECILSMKEEDAEMKQDSTKPKKKQEE